MLCSPPVFRRQTLPFFSPFLSRPYGHLHRKGIEATALFSKPLLVEYRKKCLYVTLNVLYSHLQGPDLVCVLCSLAAADALPCRFILHSHRALRFLILLTEHEQSSHCYAHNIAVVCCSIAKAVRAHTEQFFPFFQFSASILLWLVFHLMPMSVHL